jgi:hypothetical protein
MKAVMLMEESGMSERERYMYEKNLDNVRIEQALMRESKEKGITEGERIGLEKGERIGIAKGKEIGIAEGKEIGIAEGKEIGIAEGRAVEREMLINRMMEAGIAPSTIDRIIHR